MGNYRFKLSDMMPNAWFYKLNHMSTSNTRNLQNSTRKSSNKKVQSKTKSSSFSSLSTAAVPPNTCHYRKSYYFNRDLSSTSHLSEPPRKSSDRRRGTKKTKASRKLITNSFGSSECFSCHVSHKSVYTKPEHTSKLYTNYSSVRSSCDDPVLSDLDSVFGRVKVDSPSNNCDCRIENITSIRDNNQQKIEKSSKFDLVSEVKLKPIRTKFDKGDREIKPAVNFLESSVKIEEGSSCNLKKCPVRKMRVNSPGVKIRANPPRTSPKRFIQVQGLTSVSSRLKSVVVVKESIDPDGDFKESMMEMIKEHNMSTKEDFEQLLACYLSLNSDTNHGLIIKVFEQIWFEITGN